MYSDPARLQNELATITKLHALAFSKCKQFLTKWTGFFSSGLHERLYNTVYKLINAIS